MFYKEAFNRGFEATNKNILLPLIKMAAAFVLIIGFVLMLIIPVIVAVLAFGTGIFTTLKNIGIDNIGILLSSKYLLLLAVLVIMVLLYILMASVAALYIYGGASGMLVRGIREAGFKFSMEGFFSEARRLFWPVLWFTSIVGAAALIIFLFLAASVFPLKSIINTVDATSRQSAFFMTILSMLVGAVILFFFITGTLAVTIYGTAAMLFKGLTPMQASNEAVRFIIRRPSALGFYLLCVIVYFAVNIMIAGSLVGIAIIPIIGTVAAIPYQILVQAVQLYLGLLFVAVLFSYYYEVEGQAHASISETSTVVTDTSVAASEPASLPPPLADHEGNLP